MRPLIPSEFPLALLLDLASNIGGSLLVVTGVFAGAARSWAVLTELPAVRVEWMTAMGFAVGAMITILFVVVDQIWR
jgi:hypothetical protein